MSMSCFKKETIVYFKADVVKTYTICTTNGNTSPRTDIQHTHMHACTPSLKYKYIQFTYIMVTYTRKTLHIRNKTITK